MKTSSSLALRSLILLGGMTVLAPAAWAKIANPTEPYITYTVKPGDKLVVLTRQLLNDPKQWNALARLNGLKDPNLIRPGMEIDVPRSLVNFALQPKLATTGVLQSANGSVTINGAAAQAGASVPEGARVQTAAGSSAVIKMSDGSSVQLMPRTLAEVTAQHGYAMKDPSTSISTTWFSGVIRLFEGALDIAADKAAKRKEPMGVITPTSNVGIRGTQFRVAYEDPTTRTARTEVLEGRVRADNPAQAVGADVAGGFGVAIKPGDREVRAVALLPALPQSALPARVERTQSGAQVLWTVGTLSGAAGYRAELAQDPAFSQIVFDVKASSNAIDLSAAPNGSYFARVRGIDASGIEGYNASQRIDITLASSSVPSPLWVHEVNVAAMADYRPEGVLLSVNTRAVDTPRNLQMQIAEDAALTQAVQTLALDAHGKVLIPGLKAGDRRFLRFSGTSPQGAAANSPVLQLDVPPNWGSTVLGVTSALKPLR